jgi:hypothetical protein
VKRTESPAIPLREHRSSQRRDRLFEVTEFKESSEGLTVHLYNKVVLIVQQDVTLLIF